MLFLLTKVLSELLYTEFFYKDHEPYLNKTSRACSTFDSFFLGSSNYYALSTGREGVNHKKADIFNR